MKKSIFIIGFTLLFLCVFNLQAQDMFTILEGNLDDAEKTIVEDAKKDIDDADRFFSVANNDYNKYTDLFNSKKKRKKSKAEKKTVGAKKSMALASTKFHQGYEALYNLYLTKLQSYTFEFHEDEQQANNLISEAETSFGSGKNTLGKHGSYSEKQLAKDVKYKSLRSSVEKGSSDEKEAVNYLVDALQIYLGQNEKKQIGVL